MATTTKWKRILALLLVLSLSIGLLSVGAVASPGRPGGGGGGGGYVLDEDNFVGSRIFGWDTYTNGGSLIDSTGSDVYGQISVCVNGTALTKGTANRSVTNQAVVDNGVVISGIPAGYYLSAYKLVCSGKYSCETDRAGNATDATVSLDAGQGSYTVSVTKADLGHANTGATVYWILIELSAFDETNPDITYPYSVTYSYGTLSETLSAADATVDPGTYTYNGAATVLTPAASAVAAATAAGYTFAGWTISAVVGSQAITSVIGSSATAGGALTVTGNTTLTAQWECIPVQTEGEVPVRFYLEGVDISNNYAFTDSWGTLDSTGNWANIGTATTTLTESFWRSAGSVGGYLAGTHAAPDAAAVATWMTTNLITAPFDMDSVKATLQNLIGRNLLSGTDPVGTVGGETVTAQQVIDNPNAYVLVYLNVQKNNDVVTASTGGVMDGSYQASFHIHVALAANPDYPDPAGTLTVTKTFSFDADMTAAEIAAAKAALTIAVECGGATVANLTTTSHGIVEISGGAGVALGTNQDAPAVSANGLSYTWTLTVPTGETPSDTATYSITESAGVSAEDSYTVETTYVVKTATIGADESKALSVSNVYTEKPVIPTTFSVTYAVTGDAPDARDLSALGATDVSEGTAMTVAAGLESDATEKNGVPGHWVFNGWTTNDVTVAAGAYAMPAGNVTFTGTWSFVPVQHTVTVNYLEQTTNATLATRYVTAAADYGTAYDVTAKDQISIADYTYDTTTGDALTGTLNGNKVVNVYYTRNTYAVTYTVTSTENPADYSAAAVAALGQNGVAWGAAMQQQGALTTASGTKDGVPGTWSFSGWTTDDVTVAAGAYTMPKQNVSFTGAWSFTPNAMTNLTVNYYLAGTSTKLHDSYSAQNYVGLDYNVSSQILAQLTGYDSKIYVKTGETTGDAISGTLNADGVTVNVYYAEKAAYTVTVHYLEKGTNAVLRDPTVVLNAYDGSDYDATNAANQTIDLYTKDSVDGALTGALTGADVEINVYYTRDTGTLELVKTYGETSDYTDASKTYTVTVTGPEQYSEVLTLTVGQPVQLTVPTGDYTVTETGAELANYTLETAYGSAGEYTTGSAGTASVTHGETAAVEVVNTYDYVAPYVPVNYYTLTIRYVYEDGTTAAPTYSTAQTFGYRYSVASPAIEGYTPDQETVAGQLTANATYTVVYAANEVIDEEDPPLVDDPTIDIDDGETPTTDEPVDIEDGSTPLDGAPTDTTPATGDSSYPAAAAAVLFAGLVGLAGAGGYLLKKKKEDEEA